MHSSKITVLLVCVLGVVSLAMAGENLGIRATGKISFASPVRVAGTLLPAGEYVVRHYGRAGARHGVSVGEP